MSGIENLCPGSTAARNDSSTVAVCPMERILKNHIWIKIISLPVEEEVVAVVAGVDSVMVVVAGVDGAVVVVAGVVGVVIVGAGVDGVVIVGAEVDGVVAVAVVVTRLDVI